MESYDFQTNKNTDSVLKALGQHGIALIKSYLDTDRIESLIAEFESCKSLNGQWIRTLDYSVGQAYSIQRSGIDKQSLPTISDVFSAPALKEIMRRYLGETELFNHEIFLCKDVVGSTHIAQDLHFDRIPSFKFFFYLRDTSDKNGAFYCVPGSHLWTRNFQARLRADHEKPSLEISRQIPDDLIKRQIPVCAPAGSLIIFHTDTLHRTGHVQRNERLVMRGHCRLKQHMGDFNTKDVHVPRHFYQFCSHHSKENFLLPQTYVRFPLRLSQTRYSAQPQRKIDCPLQFLYSWEKLPEEGIPTYVPCRGFLKRSPEKSPRKICFRKVGFL